MEKRDRAILELLYGTGIRMGECIRLDLPISICCRGSSSSATGRARRGVVPIPARAVAALDVYLRAARPAFVRDRRVTALFTSWEGGSSP